MDSQMITSLFEHYHWQATLIAIGGIVVINMVGRMLMMRIPAFKAAMKLNQEAFQEKMKRSSYAVVMRANGRAGKIIQLTLFTLIVPFSISLATAPWWRILLDTLMILMVYDFFYYLTHRFLFHNNGFLGGPLISVHAVHHRQHVPCRVDGGYLNVWEHVIGVGLYAASIYFLARIFGEFHVVTFVVTYIAFTQINLHNHDLWTEDEFPFRYLNYTSKMHHNHHTRFTAGNYATISPLYDWLFGTLDHGMGYKKKAER